MVRKSMKSLITAVIAVITLCSCGQAEENDAEIFGTITVSLQTQTQESEEIESQTKSESQTVTEIKKETEVETEKESETKTEIETKKETETEIETETEAIVEEENFSEEPVFKIIYDGKCFGLDEISDVKAVFGTPETPELSASSCMGEGNDIVYTYDGFAVTAFEGTDGSFYVTAINVTSDKITNPKGLNVGMAEADAQKIIGGEYYEEGNFSIAFYSENGIVCEVDYTDNQAV